MKGEHGKLNSSIVVVLDFDETLFHGNESLNKFESLRELENAGAILCIASRNHYYVVWNALVAKGIEKHFTSIMVDFRPKDYQIRHILLELKKITSKPRRVVFVDDYAPNIERVRKRMPDVECYQYGVDISDLAKLVDLIR